MANSGTVTAGSAALASQYNNLRDDVLNITTGHTHTGASENGAKVAATGVSSGTAANGAVLTADGSGAAAFLAAGASGGILKYQEFTSSGSFVIPASASSSAVVVVEIGDGGEGGRGGNKQIGVQSTGGAGGALVTYYDLLSSIGTAGGTATVTIGAGGAGGAGATGIGTRGVRGVVGGYSSIGNLATKAVFSPTPNTENNGRYSPQIVVSGVFFTEYATTGMGNAGGTVAGGTVSQEFTHTSGGNAYRYNTGVAEIGVMGQDSDFNGAAGGGGAESLSPYVAYSGGHGGKRWGYRGGHFVGFDGSNGRSLITVGNGAAGGAGASGGGSAGTAATAGSGGGGGGGGNANSGNGGAGGAGAAPGGGGGGGGGSYTGNGGAGGAGGAGRLRVWVIG